MNNLISIIVPIYNSEMYLHRCIDSILVQTYENLEIILINDGSHDNSAKICDDYAKSDARVIVVHKKNAGLSAARNSGLDLMSGSYFGFVDSDDWIHPEMFGSLLSAATENNTSLALCGFGHSNDSQSLKIAKDVTNIVLQDSEELLKFYFNHGFYVWRNFYATETFGNLRFRDDVLFVEDLYYGPEVAALATKSVFIPNPLYIYYIENTTSLTRSSYSRRMFITLDAYVNMKRRVQELFTENKELLEIIRRRVQKNCLYHLQSLFNSKDKELDPEHIFAKKTKRVYNENFKYRGATLRERLIRWLPFFFLSGFFRIQTIYLRFRYGK
ncbi:glycosyltransferase [Spongiimicrobium sp. 3-5]|uniref:glycosyltransferase n=1 Tax=Spongiimicrobium sp. 3-5 TaxID=3332596 RepID=UPI0039815016